jgi:two-component system CheB/CheR fusion protein
MTDGSKNSRKDGSARRRRTRLAEVKNFRVVGIGASAGGLDAFQKFFDALPNNSRMAFILIQHLDPTHQSMMVELLSKHTQMKVQQAKNGMRIAPNRVYTIPPGFYLSVKNNTLRLSVPHERHGARLPFDFLLFSLAEQFGARAACVILSGSGADGSLGLKAVKERGGLVIAQSPDEAAFDGMPQSAIRTGAVDVILPVSKIPEALSNYDHRISSIRLKDRSPPANASQDEMGAIIELLRTRTPYDFTLYKPGTVKRRIERRMALATIQIDDMSRYLDFLRNNSPEVTLLAKDLLINVTSFFRNPEVFDYLAAKIIPDLIRQCTNRRIRVWVAGCSTGEEAYSLAMLFQEQIDELGQQVTLQIFASDIDPDAVAFAREGLYPQAIESDVSADRLAHFFRKEDSHYRVSKDLRSSIVFTKHDVLVDPSFAYIDLVSCRNLLIYLQPEGQAAVLSQFHFALRDNGVLLLGNAEAADTTDRDFEADSKPNRIYRRIGPRRPGALHLNRNMGAVTVAQKMQRSGPDLESALASVCHQIVVEKYAAVMIVINSKNECLYSLGAVDRYLRVAPGYVTHDVIAMARDGVRTALRSAIEKAKRAKKNIVCDGRYSSGNGDMFSFSIAAEPLMLEGQDLLCISFIDKPKMKRNEEYPASPQSRSRVAELEQELKHTKMELEGAIRNLEFVETAQKVDHQELIAVNEEFQSTNEELLTSKEELQSLNEELTALNSQLLETLERHRVATSDLQNVLFSTDIAMLFLDEKLNIRYFSPSVSNHFKVIASDIGRPLEDIKSLSADNCVLADCQSVMKSHQANEREIETGQGDWYTRRIVPYRSDGGLDGGVVITYINRTKERQVTNELMSAKEMAQQTNLAKSRFLAAASHDLRQPLQSLALLHGLLLKRTKDVEAKKYLTRMDEILSAMSGMLNALLDIDQLETGNVIPEKHNFSIADVLSILTSEFSYHAQSRGLDLRVITSQCRVFSDPRLLEQILRNLVSNALKYTTTGKVLVGCRRRKGMLRVEVWDSGIGIPEDELTAIFYEYHQVNEQTADHNHGLGLGLSIVEKLGNLLDHAITVRSRVGKGSVFSVDVELEEQKGTPNTSHQSSATMLNSESNADALSGQILVIEDNPELREFIKIFLSDYGHDVKTAVSGIAAMELVTKDRISPDLVIADYNLPNKINGLTAIEKLREVLDRHISAIILTGDTSIKTARDISLHDCFQLNKPVDAQGLVRTVHNLLSVSRSTNRLLLHAEKEGAAQKTRAALMVVDDDQYICEEIRRTFEARGFNVKIFASAEAFLNAPRPPGMACILIDHYLPGLTGLDLLRRIKSLHYRIAPIMMTGKGDTQMAVQAMKAGALDFIEKPFRSDEFESVINNAFEKLQKSNNITAFAADAAARIGRLTSRQREILKRVLAGDPSKNIAADLRLSQRTVENHRAVIMKKCGVKSIPALARLAIAATGDGADNLLS